MFIRSETDIRRVIIVDISHLFYKYAWGGAKSLSTVVMVNNVPEVVDTTLPTYCIKQIHKWANGGINPTVVCFDGRGCTVSRKGYFMKNSPKDNKTEYKSDRKVQNDAFYKGCESTLSLMYQGGVMCLKGDGYEADDLIKAAVDRAKIDYPNLPIDIITGDADLVPLVDDQVSVFLRSVKLTWAETPELEKPHYVQLTPKNYQEYMQGLTNYKNLLVPYNTVLLTKLLRGDKSDSIPVCNGITPKKYNALIEKMIEDGVDVSHICYYDNPIATICYRHNEQPIPLDLLESTPIEQKMIKYSDPKCITNLCEILRNYLTEEQVEFARMVYNGINLNCAYVGLGEGLNRRPATLTSPIKGYSAGQLQEVVARLKIRLPMM